MLGHESRLQIRNPGSDLTQTAAAKFVLTDQALAFVAKLQSRFGVTREELLTKRKETQTRIDAGLTPDFLAETREIRASKWRTSPAPNDLHERRVEITGPVDRKMVINALNSGADVFMADFEDSHSPTFLGTLEGQVNLMDAVRRGISYTSPEGKSYSLNSNPATLMVRPRGWHLLEKHVFLDEKPISASLFDFGLFFFHNARELIARGSGPYFYLPKIEHYLEARLWNDVFCFAQDELKIPSGTIKATVLIETILAAFQMEEILYELREHSAGLNCGRWDYIFSVIKKFSRRTESVGSRPSGFLMPDRAQVTMTSHFLKSYCELLIRTCHKRGAHAMGGMAAQIPIKNNPEANDAAMSKVFADKEREVLLGHDGTWVAHPALVEVARKAFLRMKGSNQYDVIPQVNIEASDLLQMPDGQITEKGLRNNINVALLYLESWLRGHGCVPLHNLMEDTATAEISRAQIWQWIHHPKGILSDGRKVTIELVEALFLDEISKVKTEFGERRYAAGRFADATQLLQRLLRENDFTEFLTLPAYEQLN